jgi:hypothetical protein
MKGVMLRICPYAHLVDITHEIPPQNVPAAASMLQTFPAYFPPGTIHVVVVDPGVGSERRAVALETPQARFVGPDNGVFAPLWQAAQRSWPAHDLHAVALTAPRFWLPQVSATFHGRDIFAPVAAHLAQGVALAELGPALTTITTLPTADPLWEDATRLVGQVIAIDHFGNCITNITTTHLEQLGAPADLLVHLTEAEARNDGAALAPHASHPHTVQIYHTYADVVPGAALALVGSTGHLEIAVRNGNAHEVLHIQERSTIVVQTRQH